MLAAAIAHASAGYINTAGPRRRGAGEVGGGWEPFRVDPTVLADAVARMAEFGRHVEELVAS